VTLAGPRQAPDRRLVWSASPNGADPVT
jgi:hypothetical protein